MPFDRISCANPFPLNIAFEAFSRRPAEFMTVLYACKAAEETHRRIVDDVIEAYERGGARPDSRIQGDLGRIKHDITWICNVYDNFDSDPTKQAAQAVCDAFRVFRGDVGALECHCIFYVRSAPNRQIQSDLYLLYCQCLPVLNMLAFALDHWCRNNPNETLTGFPQINV